MNTFIPSSRLYLLFLLLSFIISTGAFAQTLKVSGLVLDAKKNPLAGVTVSEKGTANSVATDNAGKYSIGVAGRNSVLLFTFVGYASIEEKVGGRRPYERALQLSDKKKGNFKLRNVIRSKRINEFKPDFLKPWRPRHPVLHLPCSGP